MLTRLFGESKEARIAGALILACLPIIVLVDHTKSTVPRIAFCLGLGATSFLDLKRRLSFIGVLLAFNMMAVYYDGFDLALRDMTCSPGNPLPVVSASVVPGGDVLHTRITDDTCINAVVCFYVGDHAVVASHSTGISFGVLDESHTRLNGGLLGSEVRVVVDSERGLVLCGLDPPDPREEMQLGNLDDILIGEPAQCLRADSDPFRVEVLGWVMRGKRQYLAIGDTWDSKKLGPGSSGTPILQNGKIVAFISAGMPIPHRGPDLGYAVPAAEVYSELAKYLDPR